MKRKLPTVDILGTAFCVDVVHEELFEQQHPANKISFNVFDQEGDGYTFLYDQERKNVPEDISAIKRLEYPYVWVTLPALMELDPEGIALKYDIPISILCPDRVPRPPDTDDFEEVEDW